MIDEPVIITGGSVEVALSDKFRENGHNGGRKKYKLDDHTLRTLKVNGVKVRDLSPTDVVTIESDDGQP